VSDRDDAGDFDVLGGRSELDVLIEQLEELLGEGIVDAEDALEVAAVAGLAQRLGAPPEALASAVAWLGDGGRELVAEGLASLDLDEIVEGLDALDAADEHEVEDALADFDDVIAAAFFSGLTDRVRPAAREVARRIRRVPDPFAFMAETGRQVARSRVVAEDLDLHDFWLAIADAGDWS
jgi:hypothetical protein